MVTQAERSECVAVLSELRAQVGDVLGQVATPMREQLLVALGEAPIEVLLCCRVERLVVALVEAARCVDESERVVGVRRHQCSAQAVLDVPQEPIAGPALVLLVLLDELL